MATLEEAIARLNSMPTLLASEMRVALHESLLMIERDAIQLAPKDQSRLAGSITDKISGSGLVLVGEVGPSVVYGANVEFGRRAGARMPPVQALMGWVQRHWQQMRVSVGQHALSHPRRTIKRQRVLPGFHGILAEQRTSVTGQYVLGGFEREMVNRRTNRRAAGRAVTEKQMRRRAFALAYAIRERGIAPNPYLRPAYNRNRLAIFERFALLGRRVSVAITSPSGTTGL